MPAIHGVHDTVMPAIHGVHDTAMPAIHGVHDTVMPAIHGVHDAVMPAIHGGIIAQSYIPCLMSTCCTSAGKDSIVPSLHPNTATE